MLTVVPIRYVADVEATRRFYAGLGLTVDAAASLDVWVQLDADAGALGIHDAAYSKGRPAGTVELAFATDERLEQVGARLAERGYPFELVAEDFGRSIRVTDPDGVVVQIQEIDLDTARRSRQQLRP